MCESDNHPTPTHVNCEFVFLLKWLSSQTLKKPTVFICVIVFVYLSSVLIRTEMVK